MYGWAAIDYYIWCICRYTSMNSAGNKVNLREMLVFFVFLHSHSIAGIRFTVQYPIPIPYNVVCITAH